MENQTLYDALYEVLYQIFPRAIIDTLIFEYTIRSNTYKYLYTILCDNELFDDVHFNKQLGIMCVKSSKSSKSYKLIDYKTGMDHDNSLIDTKMLNLTFCSKSDYTPQQIIHFSDDIIVLRYFERMYIYSLIDKNYKQTHSHYFHYFSKIIVHNNYVYVLVYFPNRYWIGQYDVLYFTEIRSSSVYCYVGYDLDISIHDDTIYICESDKININIYIHDINNFERRDVQHAIFENMKLHKNRLYQYVKNKICVYDILTLQSILEIYVGYSDNKYKLHVNDNIIMLSNEHHMIFYEIK
jgi:hypothetical protein